MKFVPKKSGRYLLVHPIGAGGMGQVYLGVQFGERGFEKRLAIKQIQYRHEHQEEDCALFEYEAKLCSHLTHGNIVPVYDFSRAPDGFQLVMEYVDGKDLSHIVRKASQVGGPLSTEFSVYVINEVCKGLSYLHHKRESPPGQPLNLVHRDISPQNVLVSYEGVVKLADFGIAKGRNRLDYTRSGLIRGKLSYLSPEQALGEPIDQRSDIFSAGVVLLELLCGTRLFQGENDFETFRKVQECVIPRPRDINPEIPPALEAIVLRAIAKDREERYQDSLDFQLELQAYLTQNHPSFGQRDVSRFMHDFFGTEMKRETDRWQELRQGLLTLPDTEPDVATAVTFSSESIADTVTQPTFARRVLRAGMVATFAIVGLGLLALFLSSYFRGVSPSQMRGTDVVKQEPSAIDRQNASIPQPESVSTSVPVAPPKAEPPLAEIEGELELIFVQDATIFQGGEFVAEVKAGEPFSLTLRTNTSHTLRFTNEKLKLDVSRNFTVSSEAPTVQRIDLTQGVADAGAAVKR